MCNALTEVDLQKSVGNGRFTGIGGSPAETTGEANLHLDATPPNLWAFLLVINHSRYFPRGEGARGDMNTAPQSLRAVLSRGQSTRELAVK